MFNPVPPRRDPDPAPAPGLPPVPAPPEPPGGVADRVAPSAFRGSVRLFRAFGADVYVHWTWFVAAYFLVQDRPVPYSSRAWDVAEYVAGFGLVLLHEFGHVLACRRVGGFADRVVLWPLGGLAFVAPPARPGASFLTTAAGPLVNVVLAPVLLAAAFYTTPADPFEWPSDLARLLHALAWFNVVILVFNLLPIYPLDGGRLLQALLWPWLGRPVATAVAAGVGLVAAVGLGVLAVALAEWWLAATAAFLMLGAAGGLSYARVLSGLQSAERRPDLTPCPNCGAAPPAGSHWRCTKCFASFDLFARAASCPKGGSHTTNMPCLECGLQTLPTAWRAVGPLDSTRPAVVTDGPHQTGASPPDAASGPPAPNP